jgi:hypothetical protein
VTCEERRTRPPGQKPEIEPGMDRRVAVSEHTDPPEASQRLLDKRIFASSDHLVREKQTKL